MRRKELQIRSSTPGARLFPTARHRRHHHRLDDEHPRMVQGAGHEEGGGNYQTLINEAPQRTREPAARAARDRGSAHVRERLSTSGILDRSRKSRAQRTLNLSSD